VQGSSLSARDLVRALLVALTGGSAIPQQVRCCAAVGTKSFVLLQNQKCSVSWLLACMSPYRSIFAVFWTLVKMKAAAQCLQTVTSSVSTRTVIGKACLRLCFCVMHCAFACAVLCCTMPCCVVLCHAVQVCLMALGHCSQEHYPVLFEELPSLMEEYQRTKQRRGTAARPEEVSSTPSCHLTAPYSAYDLHHMMPCNLIA